MEHGHEHGAHAALSGSAKCRVSLRTHSLRAGRGGAAAPSAVGSGRRARRARGRSDSSLDSLFPVTCLPTHARAAHSGVFLWCKQMRGSAPPHRVRRFLQCTPAFAINAKLRVYTAFRS